MVDDAQWLDRIEAVVAPVLASRGLDLVDTEWHREGRRWVLRFFVDKPGGVGIQDCQSFSREAGDVLDVSGLVEPSYDLEVSSPGLDRVLKKDRELRWAVGRNVHCWVGEPVDGRTEFAGRLVDVSPAALMLEEGAGTRREVPRRLVTKARLQLQAFGRTKG
ncbi:MAG TPA: ribosome maturation factor RimP [Methylomirabilota bacterium]|jgi:ribosome maturation factor RimP|nr:ribosome maturation factor RimP [Methylomirabilota bacterium]